MTMALHIPLLITLVLCFHGVHSLTDTEKQAFTANGYTVQTSGDNYVIQTTNIPKHEVGVFPGSGNPNSIKTQNFAFTFPKTPREASAATCLPQGPIMLAKNGIVIFSVYNHNKEDAVELEVFDKCNGHPDQQGVYHYHQEPNCVYGGGNDEFVGVALDGYPIYGPKDKDGKTLTSADLDKCHGKEVNGQYRYHITNDFPYTLGCFHGEVTLNNMQQNSCYFASGTSALPSFVLLALASILLYALRR